MNFYPIYKNKKLLPWIKWWILKGNKVMPKHLSEWINSAEAITLTGVYKGSPLLNLNLNGNTSQTGTPTPEAPVPVNVVKGNNIIKINDTDYQVNLKSSNLYKGYDNLQSGWLPNNGVYPTTNSSYPNAKYQLIELKNGESITVSNSITSRARIRYIDKDINQVIGTVSEAINSYFTSTGDFSSGFVNGTITAKKDFVLGILVFEKRQEIETVMINEGTTALPYEPYYDYELCKIGDSQDVIYKENNKWYVDKYIEKVVLNGSESWSTRTGGTTYAYTLSNFFDSSNREGLCDYFKYVRAGASNTQNTECIASAGTNKTLNIFTNNTNLDTVSNLKTWLSTHNTSVYYVLSTSETTEITETNLINQLEAIYNAKLQSGTNTITQTPADLPFYLNFQYYEKG